MYVYAYKLLGLDGKGKVAINIDKSGSEVEAGGKKMFLVSCFSQVRQFGLQLE